MNGDDFSARAFAAGTLRGIRSWRIDDDGATLTGVYHQHPWPAGIADANCDAAESLIWTPRLPDSHRRGSLGCTCGFYAYFDGAHNPHHSVGRVLGLIEGFGVMSVGDRGFRCEKARIVAFIDEAGGEPLATLLGRWGLTAVAKVLRLGPVQWPTTTVPRAVRQRYPDVPVIRGVGPALARFPLIPPGRPREVAA